ncbi:riboflavin biosynthesis protein RibF [Alkaliphilus metalliredigens QYMF]|uniref:Riboflavin biosynthesis protein n=1 Tax=Alkaliphilus metalliredigens (strain QYMF) TaxID=293826 RepID=A6TRK3_ALKMQ|nr:bifunctional riboflavin kinase/FAD synthetase [Alkaliphilus metalliredigens]ABR48821.1 riboflavin biosynthesis protein RibF [Alkaliphilus metalliredigens QYMF]
MKIIMKYNEVDQNIERGIALGNFDGIHLGHQRLINTLIKECKEQSLEATVYTFINHPATVISGREMPPQISNLSMKKKVFQSLGLDTLFLDEFNKEIMSLSPEAFVEEILIKKLNCKIAVVGFDYRFGYKAQGDVTLLKRLGHLHGFQVIEINPVTLDDEKISSSNIREFIADGKMNEATKFLGREYSIISEVIHGKGRGIHLGYPTANLLVHPSHLVPKEGVYATLVEIDGSVYKGATCVGTNPTFGKNSISIETFIIDYVGSIYGKEIEVRFVKYVRDQIKFEKTEDLTNQMKLDIETSKIYLHK